MSGSQNNKLRRKKKLGRGLGALIPNQPLAAAGGSSGSSKDFFECDVELIDPSPGQPRKHFDQTALEELSSSIKESGLIQPLVVRRVGERYELIAGERRLRASKLAGLEKVAVVVKDVDDAVAFALALIENIQREDLDAVEEATAYKRLIDEFDFTQAQLAEQLGKSRSAIANAIRLLSLPDNLLGLVAGEELSAGHARALLGLDDEELATELAERVRSESLTVRQTEAIARELKAAAADVPAPASEPDDASEPAQAAELVADDAAPVEDAPAPVAEPAPPVEDAATRIARATAKTKLRDDETTRSIVTELSKRWETKVSLKDRHGAGRLEIHYGSYEELQRVLDALEIDHDL